MKRRLLYINIGFYQYESHIINAFEKSGYEVITFCDKPKTNFFSLLLYRLFPKSKTDFLANEKAQMLFLKSLPENFKFDKIVVIVGRHLSFNFLNELKKKHCNGDCVLYLWDDVRRVKNFSSNFKIYDRIYSFDKIDCQTFGLTFLPLFYINDFLYNQETKNYDICCIGADHSNRFFIVSSIVKQATPLCSNNFIFLHSGFLTTFKRKLRFGSKNSSFISKEYFSLESTVNILKRSKYVIDVQYASQRGLTLRTFEALASKCKIITTNRDICNYDFYNLNNVAIIDRKNPKIDKDFFDSPYIDIDEAIVKKYSIDVWVSILLN